MKKLYISINGFVLVAFAIALSGCAMRAKTVGLKPIYPENMKRKTFSPYEGKKVFTMTDTIQPTFRWEQFPGRRDLESGDREVQKALCGIKDITYDFEVFRAENDYPAALIYSKQGLIESFHKIEMPLETCTKYFWSVRARFKLDGKTRVTGWSIGIVDQDIPENPWFSSYAPNPYFYWFQTHCPEPESKKAPGNSDFNPLGSVGNLSR